MRVLIVQISKEKLHSEEFVRPIKQIVGDCDVKSYLVIDSVDSYSHIIISGTALKDFEYLENLNKFDWVTEDKKILGICSGAQIIAKKFGVDLVENQEVGLQEIEKIKDDLILEDVELKEIYSLHNKSFELPEGFDVLLKNQKSIQLIKKNNVYACLFHPEVRNKKLIKNFVKL